jgi:hypothetical protein
VGLCDIFSVVHDVVMAERCRIKGMTWTRERLKKSDSGGLYLDIEDLRFSWAFFQLVFFFYCSIFIPL